MDADAPLTIGETLSGKYEIESELGRGGFGVVYKAKQVNIERPVAIKVLLPEIVSDTEVVRRFVQEARIVSRLNHPNIITIHDFGESGDGLLYIVMELLKGEGLDSRLEREGPLPPNEANTIARQVLRGLAAAHSRGIIHRDLKPENIFLTDPGDGTVLPKILDFGIAKAIGVGTMEMSPKLTADGKIIGTPYYMSPEQVKGQELGPTSDIYSFGAVLYESMTGEPPFHGDTIIDLLYKVVRDPAPRLPNSLGQTVIGQAIERALNKEPDDRFPTAESFADFLDGAAEMAPSETPVLGPTDATMEMDAESVSGPSAKPTAAAAAALAATGEAPLADAASGGGDATRSLTQGAGATRAATAAQDSPESGTDPAATSGPASQPTEMLILEQKRTRRIFNVVLLVVISAVAGMGVLLYNLLSDDEPAEVAEADAGVVEPAVPDAAAASTDAGTTDAAPDTATAEPQPPIRVVSTIENAALFAGDEELGALPHEIARDEIDEEATYSVRADGYLPKEIDLDPDAEDATVSVVLEEEPEEETQRAAQREPAERSPSRSTQDETMEQLRRAAEERAQREREERERQEAERAAAEQAAAEQAAAEQAQQEDEEATSDEGAGQEEDEGRTSTRPARLFERNTRPRRLLERNEE